jgi:hypothetical protein
MNRFINRIIGERLWLQFPGIRSFFIRSSSSRAAFGFSCVFMSPSISLRLVPVNMSWTEHELQSFREICGCGVIRQVSQT